MLISLIYSLRCTSGHEAKGCVVQQVRVNKGGLRSLGSGLGLIPDRCRECGADVPPVAESTRIADEDLVKVNAHRERKGWPALKSAGVIVKGGTDG